MIKRLSRDLMDVKIRQDHLKFTKDVFIVALSQFLIASFGIITLPIITKNYSVEQYGVWSQISITVALIAPMLTLHLGTATVRYFSGKPDEKLKSAFSTMLFAIIVFITIVILIAVIFKSQLAVLLFKDINYYSFAILTFFWAGTSALFSFSISYLRSRAEISKLSGVRIISAIFKVSLLVILASLGYSLIILIFSQIFVEILMSLAVYGFIINKIGVMLPDFKDLKCFLSFSLPDLPNSILIWIINSSDRYFILLYLNLFELGIYSASYSLGSLIALFYAPISFVIFPTVSKLWFKKNYTDLNKYLEYSTKIFLIFAIPATFGLYVLSEPLLKTLTTSQFFVGGEIIFLVALGTLFLGLYQINSYIIYLEQKTKFVPIITGISAILNISLNIVLIPTIGVIAAAFSTLVSYFFMALIVIIWANRTIKYKLDFIFILKLVVSSLFMALCLSLFQIDTIIEIVGYIIMGCFIYFGLLIILKTFSEIEIRLFKGIISKIKSFL